MLGPVITDIQGTTLTQEEKDYLRHPHVGGVILFTRNYESPEQLKQLTADIKALRSPALLITVDQEGGRVQRFREGFSPLPSLQSIGEAYQHSPQEGLALAKASGWLMAKELLAHGVDLSYAPVLDIDRGFNTVIGDRSFGLDPLLITNCARAYIQGMHAAGMKVVGKHFPGHGGVSVDTHLDIAKDERDLKTIEQEDLQPFLMLAKENLLAGIMPAHVIYPAIDPHPAGFSSYWLQTILRKQLGFKGVIFSDDLTMSGAHAVGDVTVRAKLALQAGCDRLIVCNHPEETIKVLTYLERKTSKIRVTPDLYGLRSEDSLKLE